MNEFDESVNNDCAVLSFKNIGISRLHPTTQILSNVSGYVVKGGITAVIGPSGSGKSLLLRALSGRIPALSITGDLFIEGVKVDPFDISNPVAYVAQDNILIGELTSRETLFNSAAMKINKPLSEIDADVDRFLDILGVGEVADNPIGTTFTTGLSDGQRKLIDIGSELVAAPLVLFLDEPTSGMDASIAYEVLKAIKEIANENIGGMSIILSIKQPDFSILELFDHIVLLGGGAMTFFGTVSESIEYFSSIGFPPLDNHIPTDYFIQVTDPTYNSCSDFNFEGMQLGYRCELSTASTLYSPVISILFCILGTFTSSALCHKLMLFLDAVGRRGSFEDTRGQYFPLKNSAESPDSYQDTEQDRFSDPPSTHTTYWRQYTILVFRDFALATRNPFLYLMQFFVNLAFSFLLGSVFFKQTSNIDATMYSFPASILWIILLMAYVQIFKVPFLSKSVVLFRHERANNTYGVLPAFFAELTGSLLWSLCIIPGSTIAYFMIGYPSDAYPLLILIFWTTTLASESLLNLLSRMVEDATASITTCQSVLIMFTAFGGGVFIPWNVTPIYWRWLQEISLFTQASRSALIHVSNYITYKCVTIGGVCYGPYKDVVACDAKRDNGQFCMVTGRTVLKMMQGTNPSESPWEAYYCLVMIFAACRVAVLLLMYFPADRWRAIFRHCFSSDTNDLVIKGMSSMRRIEAQLKSIVAEKHNSVHPIGPSNKAPPRSQAPRPDHAFEQLFDEGFDSQMDDEIIFTDPSRAPFCLVWRNLSFLVKIKHNTGKDGVTGFARSGRLLTLMGPAGGGTSTLLEALGHRVPHGTVSGEMKVGRRDFLHGDLFFVPEVEELNPNLTVQEQISFVGLMRCIDSRAMYTRLKNILRIVGMQKKATVRCSTLTRVQLKRVGVAMGMICNPSVLLLDKPTSGLDAMGSQSIIQTLIDLAHNMNVAVIMTIIHPSEMVFELLQDLYVMSAGHLAYSGPVSCIQQYFRDLGYTCPPKSSPADFILDILSRPAIYQDESWQKQYFYSNFGRNMRSRITMCDQNSSATHVATIPPKWSARLRHMVNFFFKYYSRDLGFYLFRLLSLVTTSLFIGTLFMDLVPDTESLPKYTGLIVYSIWCILLSVISCARLLIRDRRHSIEQVRNATTLPFIYCLAQFCASIPFNLASALAFQAVFYWMSNINPSIDVFLYTVLISCGHLLLMESLIMCLVQITKNAVVTVTTSTVIFGFLFLFSGFFVIVPNTPPWIRWISFLMPTRYSYEGYLFQILQSQKFLVTGTTAEYVSGEMVLHKHFNLRGGRPFFNLIILFAWIVLVRMCHYGMFLRQQWHFIPSRNRIMDRRTLSTEDACGANDDDSIPSFIGHTCL